jgi:hypothetical protein
MATIVHQVCHLPLQVVVLDKPSSKARDSTLRFSSIFIKATPFLLFFGSTGYGVRILRFIPMSMLVHFVELIGVQSGSNLITSWLGFS